MATAFIAAESGTIGAGTFRGQWQASQTWAVGDIVAPTFAYATANAKAYVYACTSAGTGGATEPTWVFTTPDTSTTTDGGATFTCREMDSWAEAGVYLNQGLLRCAADGDVLVIQYNAVPAADQVDVNVTYTILASIKFISASNDGGSAYTPTAMDGTDANLQYVGHSKRAGTAGISVRFSAPNLRVYYWGVAFVGYSSNGGGIHFYGDGSHQVIEDCILKLYNNGVLALGASDQQTFVHLINCTVDISNNGSTYSVFQVSAKVVWEGGGLGPSTPSTGGKFFTFVTTDPGGATIECHGVDFSPLGNRPIVGTAASIAAIAKLSQCKLGSGYIALDTQTHNNRSGAEVWLHDCAVGDTHGIFEFHSAQGALVSDSGIYVTSGAAAQSWKISTTGYCSYFTPFVLPWVDLYHEGVAAITPYIEILRDGSATAYQNDEVWAEFSAQETAGTVLPTFKTDRCTLANKLVGTTADQAAGAGLGSWTGESGTAWSGKCDSGSSITPAEIGHIRGRIVVGEPSITVYVDPQIRT